MPFSIKMLWSLYQSVYQFDTFTAFENTWEIMSLRLFWLYHKWQQYEPYPDNSPLDKVMVIGNSGPGG